MWESVVGRALYDAGKYLLFWKQWKKWKKKERKILILGASGAGKSQLVLNYIQEYRHDYSAVFWIEAGQKETLERDYIQIYRLLVDCRPAAGSEIVQIAVIRKHSVRRQRAGQCGAGRLRPVVRDVDRVNKVKSNNGGIRRISQRYRQVNDRRGRKVGALSSHQIVYGLTRG